MELNDSSLIREQDDRMRAHKGKENRTRGRGTGERNWNNRPEFEGGMPNFLGPPTSIVPKINGDPSDTKRPISPQYPALLT